MAAFITGASSIQRVTNSHFTASCSLRLSIRHLRLVPGSRGIIRAQVQSEPQTVLPSNSTTSSLDALRCPSCGSPIISWDNKRKNTCLVCGYGTQNTRGFYDMYSPDDRKEKKSELIVTLPRAKSLFMSPVVAFLYERGWRQQFADAGFPGDEKEFEMIKEFVFGISQTKKSKNQAADAKTVRPAKLGVDLSCGSGFMARRMANSGLFEHVIGIDSSKEMLAESSRRSETRSERDKITWVLADAQRLPLEACSVDLVQAGAAIHCWTQIPDVLNQINLVLKPDGYFFGTTFAEPNVPGMQFMKSLGQLGWSSTFRAFSEKELEYLLRAAGFDRIKVQRIRNCLIMFARKKAGSE